MTDKSATERLRELLDECGIEWKDGDAAYEIEWSTPDGRRCSAMYWKPTFSVLISGCTPEQAIAATLDGGKCEVVASYDTSDVDSRNSNAEWYFAFSCGHELYWDEGEPPKHCPECGARIRKAVKR